MTELTCVVCLRNKNAAGGVSDAETVYDGNALCREHFDDAYNHPSGTDLFERLNLRRAQSRDW